MLGFNLELKNMYIFLHISVEGFHSSNPDLLPILAENNSRGYHPNCLKNEEWWKDSDDWNPLPKVYLE